MRLDGAFTALYTPFQGDGSVDLDAYRGLCHRLLDAGVGLVPCGTTGETPTLNSEEYDALVRCAVEASKGRRPVIAGTGSNSTAATIAQTRHAKALGVDVALVVVPYYNKPPQASLKAHFEAVADEGGLPVMLYNVPGRTARNMEVDTIVALSEHPNIVAVKEASGDIDQIQRICLGVPEGFWVLSGDDALTLPLIHAGGHGVVSVAGNVVPVELQAMVQAALSGDNALAGAWQRKLLPLFDILFATSNPIPVKRAAEILGHADRLTRMPLLASECSAAMAEKIGATLRAVMSGL
jgi:4-hydroxy-tetrahydrodipicolinate synthase